MIAKAKGAKIMILKYGLFCFGIIGYVVDLNSNGIYDVER
jgi:hypothetical protein